MATNIGELILRFTGDPRQLKQVIAQVRSELGQLNNVQVASARDLARQTQQVDQRRVADTIRSANQRLREEQRTAREVARITAETARQAAAQDRVRERAAKTLSDVRIREAKRAAKELERSLATGGSGNTSGILSGLSSLPVIGPQVGRLTSSFAGLTAEATAAGGAIAAIAGPITVAAAAATAGVVAFGLLGKAIFDTAKQAAEFQGKFFDLSQQVGVSVETLSTLDLVAATTGGNIETVSASLAIFQKNLEDAHDPTSEEAKLLKDLGVSTLETEGAFRQALKGLFAYGESAKQTDAVLQLFGRSGRFVNAILKESKGDIDAAAKAFGGLVVTREAAAAADAFNDSLEILNRTLANVGRQIVGSTIPVFTIFFQDLNKALTGNAADWSFWSNIVEVEIAGVLGTFQGFVQYVASGGFLDLGIAIDTSIKSLLERSRRLRNQLKFEADVAFLQRLTQSILAGRPGDRPDAGKANQEAATRANKAIQLQQRALEESTRNHRETLERERDLDLKNIEEWEDESIIAASEHLTKQQAIYDQESENVKRFVTNQEDALLAETEIQQKRTKLVNDTVKEIDSVRLEAEKRRNQSELALNQQLVSIRDAEREQELQAIRADLERQGIFESEALQRQLALLKQAFDDRKIVRELELNQATTSAAKQAQLLNEQLEADIRYTTEFKRLTEERINAMVREGATRVPRPGGPVPDLTDDERARTAGAIANATAGVPPPPDFTLWEQALAGLKEKMVEFSTFARGTFISVFQGISSAVAQGVEAWALYGQSIGEAMKMALAAVLARISGEATFQGLLHAAYAIGSLALLDFRGAAQHGLAAAKFFAVAAATGLGARAIAGNSGQSAFAQSSGSGNRQVIGPAPNNNEQRSIDVGRNQAERADVNVNVTLGFKDGFDDVVEASVVQKVRGGGRLRNLLLNGQEM